MRVPITDISGAQAPLSHDARDSARRAAAFESAWDRVRPRVNARIAAAKLAITSGAMPQRRHWTAARNAARIANDHSNHVRDWYSLGLCDAREHAEAMGASIYAVAVRHAVERKYFGR